LSVNHCHTAKHCQKDCHGSPLSHCHRPYMYGRQRGTDTDSGADCTPSNGHLPMAAAAAPGRARQSAPAAVTLRQNNGLLAPAEGAQEPCQHPVATRETGDNNHANPATLFSDTAFQSFTGLFCVNRCHSNGRASGPGGPGARAQARKETIKQPNMRKSLIYEFFSRL
jgi:hypothetical protein